jgi:hypothetical protein
MRRRRSRLPPLVRLSLVSLLLGSLAAAEEPPKPEAGPVDPASAKVREARLPPRKGTPEEALQAFLAAHAALEAGDSDAALRALLEFECNEGRLELPARYRASAEKRRKALVEALDAEYGKACALYREDRAKGREALGAIAGRCPDLPHGEAAAALLETDSLEKAIADARALDAASKRPEARELLEKAIRALPRALLRYEAKTLLRDLGGPDLLEPHERFEGGATEGEPAETEKEEEDDAAVTISPGPK